MLSRTDILNSLAEVERLAQAGKLNRLLNAPARYLATAYFNKVTYPSKRKPQERNTTTAYGLPFTVALPAGTDIYLTGGKTHPSEIKLARFLVRHLQENNSYVDVGAHYGFFAGLATTLSDTIKVTCFEPAPDTFKFLQQNLETTNVELRQKGLADEESELTFYQFPTQYSEYNSLDIEQYRHEAWFMDYPPQALQVAISTLDAEFNTPPDVLKIDVEGVEDRVITGGSALLQQGKTVIIMEFLPPTTSNGSHHRAYQLLLSWGYQAYQLTADGNLQPCPDPNRWMKQENLDSVNLVFCTTLPEVVI